MTAASAIRPDVQSFLDLLATTPLAKLGQLSVEDTRAVMRQGQAARPPVTDDGALAIREVAFEYEQARIGLRCYRPRGTTDDGPVIVYFHGGGFVLGDLDSHDGFCRTMAQAMAMPVVSVDYRLAPEHPWPAAPDDAEAAVRWIATAGADGLGIAATGLILAGDSAGANLSAVTARALADRPISIPVLAQYLIYPCISPDRTTGSSRDNAEGFFLTRDALAWFEANYAAPSGHPRFDLLAFDQTGMPPTLVVTAGLDPLRDEGRLYAAKLIERGISVVYQEAAGNIHGCFNLGSVIPSTIADIERSFAGLRALLFDQDLSAAALASA